MRTFLRRDFLLDQLQFRARFDGGFVSCEIGFRKIDPRFWRKVLESLSGVSPGSMLLFDDREPNLLQAKNLGISGFHISGEHSITELKAILEDEIAEREGAVALSQPFAQGTEA